MRNAGPNTFSDRGRTACAVRACVLVLLLSVAWALPVAVAADAEEGDGAALKLAVNERLYIKTLIRNRLSEEGISDEEVDLLRDLLGRIESRGRKGDRPEREWLEEGLKEVLREAVARDPDAREPRMLLGLFYLYAGEPDKAARHFERAGPASKGDILWPMRMAGSYLRLGEYERAAQLLEHVESLVLRLVPLRIERALFCSAVRQHGQYDPLPEGAVLEAGQTTWIYVEVRGCAFREEGDAVTLDLAFGLALRDDLQRTVWTQSDYCAIRPEYRHPVREVFAGIDFILPEKLPAGTYTLILTCTDRHSRKSAESDIVFQLR